MKFVKLIGPFAIYFALVVYCISYLNHPLHNWDVLGYVAAAHSFEEKDPQALHKFTFDQVRKSVSDQTYKALASPPGDEPQAVYRRTMSKNPYAFYEQLQFYQIRPVYTGSIYLLSKLGVNIVYATHLISGIAVVVGIMILYLLCKAFLAGPFVYLAPFFAIVFGALDLVRYSTPDGLAFCAVITSAYLFLKDNKAWLLLLFPIMIGIRTDLLLFVGPFFVFLLLERSDKRWLVGISGMVTVIVYVAIVKYWHNVGWATNFYFGFVELLAFPVSSVPTLTILDYFRAVNRGVRELLLLRNVEFIVYVAMAVISFSLIWLERAHTSIWGRITTNTSILAIVSTIYVISHFILLPTMPSRYFTGEYLVGTLALCLMLSNKYEISERNA